MIKTGNKKKIHIKRKVHKTKLHKIDFWAAFTLIELMVVIAIIGFLASVVLVATSSARATARDTQRILNVNAIKSSLDVYYEYHGYYPYGTELTASFIIDNYVRWTDLGHELGIASLPSSLQGPGTSTFYEYIATCTTPVCGANTEISDNKGGRYCVILGRESYLLLAVMESQSSKNYGGGIVPGSDYYAVGGNDFQVFQGTCLDAVEHL